MYFIQVLTLVVLATLLSAGGASTTTSTTTTTNNTLPNKPDSPNPLVNLTSSPTHKPHHVFPSFFHLFKTNKTASHNVSHKDQSPKSLEQNEAGKATSQSSSGNTAEHVPEKVAPRADAQPVGANDSSRDVSSSAASSRKSDRSPRAVGAKANNAAGKSGVADSANRLVSASTPTKSEHKQQSKLVDALKLNSTKAASSSVRNLTSSAAKN